MQLVLDCLYTALRTDFLFENALRDARAALKRLLSNANARSLSRPGVGPRGPLRKIFLQA